MRSYFRRLKVVTHGKEQTQIASVFLFWFMVFALVITSLYFLNYAEVASRADDMPIHDRLLTQMLLLEQAKDFAIWYGGAVLAFCALLWVYMLVYVHRLTGPVYKLQRLLDECSQTGRLPDTDLKFRKNDGFHELAARFNTFVRSLKDSPKEGG
ncbi:MAG: hypothetical protein EA369_05905 [Bradymonadales bacterium]|nr:MAG: hypothetical protein EA369_05905 [Bradymonadales bacterium]